MTTDIITSLHLDSQLTPGEIEDFLAVLEKEVWFRVLEEELPKQIARSDYTYIANILAPKHDLTLIIDYIKTNFPSIPIETIVERTTADVKREFTEQYRQVTSLGSLTSTPGE